METDIPLQILLVKPTPGVVFGLQKGSGSKYETVQKQVSSSNDLSFEFTIKVRGDRSKPPKFSGNFVQGPAGNQFVYIDIGTYAGQADSFWSRRLKIPLTGISWKDIDALSANLKLQANVPGTGKDGGPNCATVRPFEGWLIKE